MSELLLLKALNKYFPKDISQKIIRDNTEIFFDKGGYPITSLNILGVDIFRIFIKRMIKTYSSINKMIKEKPNSYYCWTHNEHFKIVLLLENDVNFDDLFYGPVHPGRGDNSHLTGLKTVKFTYTLNKYLYYDIGISIGDVFIGEFHKDYAFDYLCNIFLAGKGHIEFEVELTYFKSLPDIIKPILLSLKQDFPICQNYSFETIVSDEKYLNIKSIYPCK
jgi:hypothetical protein